MPRHALRGPFLKDPFARRSAEVRLMCQSRIENPQTPRAQCSATTRALDPQGIDSTLFEVAKDSVCFALVWGPLAARSRCPC
ncbi:hypothetical protein AMC82_PC00381 (plasmid) [Rhizobium phaseoli]|uniref:Uncharacterized protein n=5 Tax=Rhizobium TaxID=379 RepID=A0ABN4QRX5_9HYPH|nr:hypothetical protein AMC87_PC00422 [Rhizobium phaseoli]ANL81746.1 hypothetical protein AMC82_PC00381 [Rhizobium phaseoli]ANL88235.1 hypothetical protein AMC81_PD00385 [Rhizobium phaseoli]ANL94744.1 hypothetical protein AMC80_PD00385 [Rhizobium phaseoli]ANM01158.1 hypothetical protein AMC79_PC00360 [Rhizobium phaseoli]